MSNIFFQPAYGIASQEWVQGLSYYTQTNCQVSLTSNGYRIYRPPNLTTANNGNTMWGGLKIVNASVNSLNHTYDPTIDNMYDLIQNHTYMIRFHVSGQSTNTFATFSWLNQMGWSGGGLNANPSNVSYQGIPANFQGNMECWYKFTITDTISKTCTSTYSYAVAGNEYLSYSHFGVGFGYTSTGTLGTDLYITNLRMYDITNVQNLSINKQGQLLTTEVMQLPDNTAHIEKYGSILSNNFYEY